MTDIRRKIIRNKKFLYKIYLEWYQHILHHLPDLDGAVCELGSGAGFLDDLIPEVIKTEINWTKNVQLQMDARNLPFAKTSLRAIVMTDVLHHIPDPHFFFHEAVRCLKPGGTVVMVEPWLSSWSHWIFRNFHHEPFNPEVPDWEFKSAGPLSGANGALPWIIFERDRSRFENEFSQLTIEAIHLLMPFRYLVSGGFSMRSLSPDWTFPIWKMAEKALEPWFRYLAMFAIIVLRKSK